MSVTPPKQTFPLVTDERNQDDRIIGALIKRVGLGWPGLALFRKSLRVGSGAATLAALDGTDGFVMADGAQAAFAGRDRADSTKRFAWYRNATIRLGNEANDLWLIDPTTGAATLALANGAWTTVAAGVGFTNGWVDVGLGNQVMRYRKTILGNVEVQGIIKSGTLGAAAFTLPAGLRPPALIYTVGLDSANAACRIDVASSGAVTVQTGNTALIAWNAQFSTI